MSTGKWRILVFATTLITVFLIVLCQKIIAAHDVAVSIRKLDESLTELSKPIPASILKDAVGLIFD